MVQNCTQGNGETTRHDEFGITVRGARKKHRMSQAALGGKVHVTRLVVGNWERGVNAPDPTTAIQVASALGLDPTELLLLALRQKAGPADARSGPLAEVVDNLLLLQKHGPSPVPERTIPSLSSHLTLMDFPHGFKPLTVVVGDKREDEPQNAGDLFVFSASSVDDRWLASLGLPAETEKISDKVLITAKDDPNWLREKFGSRHILCIGSPASNLFAREHNDRFLFKFAISREATAKWRQRRIDMDKCRGLADLSKFYHDNKPDLKQIMRLFKPPGFIDFNYRHLKLGIDVAWYMDFAVISIGQNPFAEPDSGFFSILIAGIHHPGTANAVKFLATPENFEKHPFGGVLEVHVPSKDFDQSRMEWHNKIENCSIDWHTAGGESLEYTPESLREMLDNSWLPKVQAGEIVTDVEINEAEIADHVELIEQLARHRAGDHEPSEGVLPHGS